MFRQFLQIVKEVNPLKQGLKRPAECTDYKNGKVKEVNPLKQGLKPITL